MNRTERLYALVEELRAVAPRPRSATWLARRFEVSPRTVERDLDALRQAGVPIWSEAGRRGGYALDRERTLAPLALTAAESLAISVALRSVAGSPFAAAARSAAQKVRAGLTGDVRRIEESLAERVYRLDDGGDRPADPDLLAAVAARRVLRLHYLAADGTATDRDVEPLGLLTAPTGWFLVAWCRLREGVRGFRVDRIGSLAVLDETAPPRDAALTAELRRLDARPVVDADEG